MYVHLTIRVQRLTIALSEHAVASWLWSRLRRTFPAALAAIIMPNHLHLAAPTEDPGAARQGLRDLVAGLRRSHCPVAPCSWEPVPPPEIIPDLKHLRRLVRYLALNPCRAGLASDPLSWPWSTHRDVVGAVADPWIDGSRLAAALVLPAQGFAVAHHAYVSGDPCVSTAGTPFSRRAAPTPVAVQPLAALAAAAAAATRAAPADIKRRSPTRALLLELAGRHGWQDGPRLAALCEVGRWTVWRGLHQRDEAALAAAELCLGDERLRIWRTPQRRSPVESHKTCDSGAERWAIAPRITHFV